MVQARGRKVSAESIQAANSLRDIPLLTAMKALGAYCKEDRSYQPVRHQGARRYHVSVANREFELLILERKWFDARANTGGGGSIDLTMHLFSEAFSRSLGRLSRAMGPKASELT